MRTLALRVSSLTLFAAALAGCGVSSSEPSPEGDAKAAIQAATGTTRQCVSIVATEDANINPVSPDKNYGTSGSLSVGQAVGAAPRETLIRFDLSSLPPGKTIQAATATLTTVVAYDAAAATSARRVTAPWSEGKVTWNSFAGARAAAIEGTFPAGARVSADVTNIVKEWYGGVTPNYGLHLARDYTGATTFASREGTSLQRPKLDVCYCPGGFTGLACDVDIDECAPNPCQNGSSCTDGVNAYTCACLPGFTGKNCEIDIDECASNPCQNGGSCTDGVNAYTCACPPGFTGKDCQINIDDCASGPCQNGASCVDGVNAYTCACLPGFTGKDCQIDIDDCASGPCQNGGSCADGVNAYTCACLPGFAGKDCQINIDDCASNPCQNGASCVDGVNAYACACLPGFTGKDCQINIDDCASNPCQNGASCVDGVNAFTCSCVPGWVGARCEIDVGPQPFCAVVGQRCYTGPAGTLNVGACKPGTCDASLTCQSEVTPRFETCGSLEDLDCSGATVSCTPSTSHPRLWLSPADLGKLQSWAAAGNPVYQAGLVPLLQKAEALYSSQGLLDANGRPLESFFPPSLNGAPNPHWPDDGTSGVGDNRVETIAQLFAFRSLLATDPAEKAAYATKAKKLVLYAFDKALSCTGEQDPYCSGIFSFFNRANYIGEAWGLTIDWIYPYLTPTEKALVRTVFLKWAKQISEAVFFAPDLAHISPSVDIQSGNNTQLLSNKWNGNNYRQSRLALNNYYSGAMRNLILMALAFDANDDPAVNPSLPASALGNTLRSYIPYIFNVALYQQYAMYEEASKVVSEYHLENMLSSVNVGLGSGGMPVEGFLYGHSMAYVLEGLLALHTAQHDDARKWGPQAKLFTSDYWDKLRDGFLTSISYAPVPTPSTYPYGSVYQMSSYGDLLSFYITDYDYIPLLSALALRHDRLGDDEEKQKELWALVNTMPGGLGFFTQHIASAFTNSGATTAILAFMALDPSYALSSYQDPRPEMPLTFYAAPLARLVQRTSHAPDATLLDHVCSWESINHQNGNCGQFQMHRKGEWLTTEMPGYDNSVYNANGVLVSLPYGYTPDYHNTLSIQNDLTNVNPIYMGDDEKANAERGGQWNNDANVGDPTTRASAADDQPYTFLQDDMTNLYNRVRHKNSNVPNERATAVKHASRSMLWIKPDHVVLYDRAETGPQAAGAPDLSLFKRFNLVLLQKKNTGAKVTQNAAGWVTEETTAGGQSLFVQTLLPSGVKPQILPLEPLHPAASLNPALTTTTTGVRFRVEEIGNSSKRTRFLHVLQGADAGQAQDPVKQVASASGVPFEGASITRGAITHDVLFAKDLSSVASFDVMSYAAGAGSHVVYVVDLAPGATYHVQTGATVVVRAQPASGTTPVKADDGGVLRLAF